MTKIVDRCQQAVRAAGAVGSASPGERPASCGGGLGSRGAESFLAGTSNGALRPCRVCRFQTPCSVVVPGFHGICTQTTLAHAADACEDTSR